jgi:hypothetical protein
MTDGIHVPEARHGHAREAATVTRFTSARETTDESQRTLDATWPEEGSHPRGVHRPFLASTARSLASRLSAVDVLGEELNANSHAQSQPSSSSLDDNASGAGQAVPFLSVFATPEEGIVTGRTLITRARETSDDQRG